VPKGFFSVLAERVSVALRVKNVLYSALSTFLSTCFATRNFRHYAPVAAKAKRARVALRRNVPSLKSPYRQRRAAAAWQGFLVQEFLTLQPPDAKD